MPAAGTAEMLDLLFTHKDPIEVVEDPIPAIDTLRSLLVEVHIETRLGYPGNKVMTSLVWLFPQHADL